MSRRRAVLLAAYAASGALALAFFAFVMRRLIDIGDFPAHVRVAEGLADGTGRLAPHFAYHVLVVAAHGLLPDVTWPGAAIVVTVAAAVATAVLLAYWLGTEMPDEAGAAPLLLVPAVSAALLVANPLLGPGPLVRDPFLIGYFPPNQLHSPTTIASKPLAMLLFTVVASALAGTTAGSFRPVIACAALVACGALMKPSYLIALLPAAGLLALAYWRRVDWRVIALGLAAPAAALLLLQFAFYYQDTANGLSVILAPLVVIGLYADTSALALGAKLLASIAFPLAVAVMFPRTLRDHRAQLAWVTFAVGSAYGYLLAEGGGHQDNANFLWSGQLAAFVLFAASAVLATGEIFGRAAVRSRRTWAAAGVCAALLAAHAASGLGRLRASWYD